MYLRALLFTLNVSAANIVGAIVSFVYARLVVAATISHFGAF
jgi:hypothetical protein